MKFEASMRNPDHEDPSPRDVLEGLPGLGLLFQAGVVGVELVDDGGRRIDANDRLCEILGRPLEDLTGRLVEEATHPEDVEAEAILARRLIEGRLRSYRLEKRIMGGNGRWACVEVESIRIDGPVPMRVTIVVVRDGRSEEEGARRRALMEQAPLSVALIDPASGRFVEFNAPAHESLGYTAQEFSALGLQDLYEGGEGEAAAERIASILETGRGRCETGHRTRGGSLVRVIESLRRVEIDGRPFIQAVWQEVAGPGEPAPEKARHEALVRQVLRSAPLPMGIAELREDEADVLHIYDNPAGCRALGREPGTTAGRWSLEELELDRSAQKSWIEAYRASRRLGHAVRFEEWMDGTGDSDGRWLRVVVSYVGPGASGRDRFCYIAEDVTERKHAEEEIRRLNRSLEWKAQELQTVFEVMPIGVGIAEDAECRSIRSNPMLAAMLRAPADANLSKTAPEGVACNTFRIFHEGRELADDQLPMQLSARRGVALRDVEVDVVFEDGTTVNFLEYVAPLFDDQGRPRGCVAAVLDVSERKRAELERERLLQSLREADRRKDEFLAMLAHELRNPLSAAGNAAQILLLKEVEDPDVRWCCDVIDRQTRRLARLLEDLLDVSRITRGKVVLRRETIDLREVVERAVETVRPMIDSKRHRVEVRAPDAPLWVEADPTRLEQIVVNLVGNAAKYSEEGRTIAVDASREGLEAVIRVEDEGVGMAPEVLAKVFDLFAQADSTIDRSQGGLGVGLTIARSLVEMHGGTVSASSDGPGLGSTFAVRLPAAPPPATVDEPAPVTVPAIVPRRILVVDDNADAAQSLARLLSRGGHHVEMAYDGPSGLRIFGRVRPQVVVLDIGLPGMDGYEVAERLRASPGGTDLLLIALTGYGQEADRRRALAAGFDLHLVKPVDLDVIQEALRPSSGGS